MKFAPSVIAVLCSLCLCSASYGAGKVRVRSKPPTTSQKINDLVEQQARLLRIQEAQQRQLLEMSSRLNASRSTVGAGQGEPYSFP